MNFLRRDNTDDYNDAVKNASKGKKNRFIPVFVACKAVLVKWSVM